MSLLSNFLQSVKKKKWETDQDEKFQITMKLP